MNFLPPSVEFEDC